MASRTYAGSLLIIITILFAIQNSAASVHQGNGIKMKWLRGVTSITKTYVLLYSTVSFDCKPPRYALDVNGRNNIGGRKMLQEHDEKLSNASENKKPATDAHNHNVDNSKWLEAADEVVNLMNKDYKGGPRPKRNPPIHNHEPTD